MNKFNCDGKAGFLLATYDNGFLTTAGFVEELVESDEPITYLGHAGLELPVNWHSILWIDDRGVTQHLIDIDLEESEQSSVDHRAAAKPVFTMEDGYKSWSVTEV